MPDARLQEVLTQATADVLERMFFSGFAAESDVAPDAGPEIAAMLDFDGDQRGTLALSISTDAARTLAADFLGTDDESGPSELQMQEVVCELVNMICGHALSALEKTALRLTSPRIVPAADALLFSDSCRRSFDLGNGWLTVALAIRKRDD